MKTPASGKKVKSIEAVRIVVKKKGGHQNVPHGGAWKVAYADFVTAMMSLFIVLWLLSSSQKVQKAVGGYFRDPTGTGNLMGSTNAGVGADMKVKDTDLEKLKTKIQKAMAAEIHDFQKLKDYVQLSVTEEGLRIELLESEKGIFFENGKPTPTPLGVEIFIRLAAELGQLPNQIVIEGHTDARPYPEGRDYSNWELSTDRANAARRLMQQNGLRADQVAHVRGYADQHLRKPEAPDDPSNRRVSIVVRHYNEFPEIAKASDAGNNKPQSGSSK
jgi:chemotaxis protein MotB